MYHIPAQRRSKKVQMKRQAYALVQNQVRTNDTGLEQRYVDNKTANLSKSLAGALPSKHNNPARYQ